LVPNVSYPKMSPHSSSPQMEMWCDVVILMYCLKITVEEPSFPECYLESFQCYILHFVILGKNSTKTMTFFPFKKKWNATNFSR
jgi:hypothetical protein